MALHKHVLVVANITAASEELCRVLSERARREPASFTLLIPATSAGGGREAAEQTLRLAVESLRAVGLDADGRVGADDPIVAVSEAWDPRRFDEIVVATLPMRFSEWLHAGLPERIFKLTGMPTTHIVAEPPKSYVEGTPPPVHEHPDVLAPLKVLTWGGPHDRR